MKTVKQDGNAKVVEWEEEGEVQRVILPRGEDNSELGIPYGLPFTELLTPHVGEEMAQRINSELHKRQLWTYEDISKRPNEAWGAIQAAYGVDYAKLLQLAKEVR